MGSTGVSEVNGIMSIGQGGQTLTGTKEGDLKVQFAEVMSQMTTQVGGGHSYGTGSSKQDVTVVTDKNSAADSYERYQNTAGNIKNSQADNTSVQTDHVDEKLSAYEEDVRQVLKDKLGVTDEEITDAMQKLGLAVADLIQPNQLAQLTAELTGCENVGELLCNDSFMEIVNEIGELSQNLLNDLGMTPQTFMETFTAAVPEQQPETSPDANYVSDIQVSEDNGTETENVNVNALQQPVIPDAENNDPVEQTLSTDGTEIQKNQEPQKSQEPQDKIVVQNEVSGNAEDIADVGKADVKDENGLQDEMIENTLSEEDTFVQDETKEPGMESESEDGQTGNKNESGNTSNQTAFVNQQHTAEPAVAKTPENVPQFSRQLDTLDLIRQVTEFTKVTVREAQTTMEMQLNPEHLGKLYIEVTTREGNVSAHIMTQNELVKEALESQMAELKQSMNQAGVKVDAVEVTVGSHEFEKNLEQNAKQDERQAEEQEKTLPKTRRINLDNLDELSGVMSEEEALVAQIMADRGNSVDYTA